MYRFHKSNKKQGTKAHIVGEQKSNFTPFDMRDTAYLEHLSKELKLRNARAGLLSLRNDMLQANKRANFQNEYDRIMNELSRPNLPYPTKEHLEDRIRQMKAMKFS